MKAIFWCVFLLTAYTYLGYPILLWIQARIRPRRVASNSDATPTVTVVMAARNEAQNLPQKLQNLSQVKYPDERLQIVIVSDGSTDGTPELLRANRRVVPVILDTSVGKATALNNGVRQAIGEILVFFDVRQTVEPDAITELVACFADPEVGAVSGELLLQSSADGRPEGLGVYWALEKFVRKMESVSGSVIGVTGAIYAIRREFFTEIPSGTILDDVFVPMCVAARGKRVVFQDQAVARDRIFSERGKEFGRKVRTLTGNYQLLRLAPWLLSSKNPLRFRFISHKLLRLLVPFLLIVMLGTSGLAMGRSYRALFWFQVGFYFFAAVGLAFPRAQRLKPVSIAATFVTLNVAAGMAFYNFISDENEVWV